MNNRDALTFLIQHNSFIKVIKLLVDDTLKRLFSILYLFKGKAVNNFIIKYSL